MIHKTEIVGATDQIHPRLKRLEATCSMAEIARQAGEPFSKGPIQALDELFLEQGTPELKTSAWSLIRHYLKTHHPLALKQLSGRTLLGLTTDLKQLLLGYVIDLLVSRGISPKEISSKRTL